jgi:ABC-type arginine transport system permease subunit
LEDYAVGISRNQLIIEVYKTVIGALSNIAWMLLFFFVATMVVMAVLKVLAAHK